MKKSAKYKWLKDYRRTERVVSAGTMWLKPWYDKVIAHRKKMGKTVPDRKILSINQEEFLGIKHLTRYQNKDCRTSLAVHLHTRGEIEFYD